MSTTLKREWRIILADDHELVRSGLKTLISGHQGLVVVGEARNGHELVELLNRSYCDLVILDLSMPELNGFKTLALLKRHSAKTKILILSMHSSLSYLKETVRRGADGYILKEDAFERLVWAIEEIRAGRRAFSPTVSTLAIEPTSEEHSVEILSRRQREVLKFVSQGLTSKHIGDKMCISPRTVESHRSKIMETLSIPNYAGLIKFALAAFPE